MNQFARNIAPSERPWPTTRAADGLPRVAWTVDDLDRMVAAGLLPEGGGLELLWGDLVPMAAKGIRHEVVRHAILRWLIRRVPDDLDVASELGWRPAPTAYFEPEILIAPRSVASLPTIAGTDVLLLIEVADISLAYDTSTKADAYAKLGVGDYWVIAAQSLETRVYRNPTEAGYPPPMVIPASDIVMPLLLPDLAMRLAEIVT